MAKNSKGDYFGLPYLVSLLLAFIPVTSWVLGAVTCFQNKRIIQGVFRLIFGFSIVWLLDLVFMIFSKHICRFWIFC